MTRESTTNRCIVTSNKKYMIAYEILYILGLFAVMIGALVDYLLKTNTYLLFSIVIASAMFVIATLIWVIDRKCEPLTTKT